MSNKTLKIKRVFAYSIYNNIRNTPPKDFPTTGEIKDTISVLLPALKDVVSEYVNILKDAEDLQSKLSSKEIPEDEAKKKVEAVNESFRKYNSDHGQEICDVVLSEEGFKTLKAQFERENWGKKWVMNIEEFGELMEAFSEAGK